MSESKIVYGKGGNVTFVGPDATRLFSAAALHSAVGLLSHGIAPSRGWTMTRALKTVSSYTGKTYKRTQHAQARADLKIWIETMKSALPTETSV